VFVVACAGPGRIECNQGAATDAAGHRCGGIDAACRDKWDQAEGLFVQAAQISREDVPARHQYARALWRRGARQDAIAVMAQAVQLSGSDPQLHVELGEMYFTVGDVERAHQHAAAAIRGNPKSAAAWALQGDLRRRQDDNMGALAAYHRALSLQPGFPRVQLEVADLYLRQEHPRRALATLDRLAQSYPSDTVPGDVCYRQGIALLELKRYGEAVDRLATAMDRGVVTAEAYYHVGRAELLSGRPASARWALQQALALDPALQSARMLLSKIDESQRQMAAAEPAPVIP
jgi:Flp pilus assembly protein TadD